MILNSNPFALLTELNGGTLFPATKFVCEGIQMAPCMRC